VAGEMAMAGDRRVHLSGKANKLDPSLLVQGPARAPDGIFALDARLEPQLTATSISNSWKAPRSAALPDAGTASLTPSQQLSSTSPDGAYGGGRSGRRRPLSVVARPMRRTHRQVEVDRALLGRREACRTASGKRPANAALPRVRNRGRRQLRFEARVECKDAVRRASALTSSEGSRLFALPLKWTRRSPAIAISPATSMSPHRAQAVPHDARPLGGHRIDVERGGDLALVRRSARTRVSGPSWCACKSPSTRMGRPAAVNRRWIDIQEPCLRPHAALDQGHAEPAARGPAHEFGNHVIDHERIGGPACVAGLPSAPGSARVDRTWRCVSRRIGRQDELSASVGLDRPCSRSRLRRRGGPDARIDARRSA